MAQRDERFVPHVLAVVAGSDGRLPERGRRLPQRLLALRRRRSERRASTSAAIPKGTSRSVTFAKRGNRSGVLPHSFGHERHRVSSSRIRSSRLPTTTIASSIDDVPEGDYTIVGWHERIKPITRRVHVIAGPDDDGRLQHPAAAGRQGRALMTARRSRRCAVARAAARSSVKLAALGAAVTAAVVSRRVLGAERRDPHEHAAAASTSQLARNQRTLQQLQARDASQLLFAASLITQTPSFQYDLNIYRVEKNATAQARASISSTRSKRSCATGCAASTPTCSLVTDDSGRVFAAAARDGATVPRGTSLLVAQRGAARARPERAGRHAATSPCCAPTPAISRSPSTRSCKTASRSARWCSDGGSTRRSSRRRAPTSDADVVLTAGNRVARRERSRARDADASPRSSRRARATRRRRRVRLGGEDYVVAPLSLGETQDVTSRCVSGCCSR